MNGGSHEGSKPFTLAGYIGGPRPEAFVEPVAVGDSLPDMPLFLAPDCYILIPLERTYQATWDARPAVLKELLEATDEEPTTES